MPFFCRSGHPVVTPDQFLDFVGHLLPHLDLPWITGRDLQEVARAWNEIKALLWGGWVFLTGFAGFIFLFKVRFVSSSSLLLDLVSLGAGMVVSLRVVL